MVGSLVSHACVPGSSLSFEDCFLNRVFLSFPLLYMYIHLSNVLTDHFSNSLSEKTTNYIPMKFSQCHFNTTFYRLPLPNRGIYLKTIQVRRKVIFMFYRHASRALTLSHFKVDILQDSESPHKINTKYCGL